MKRRRGEVYALPQPGIFEPRLALYSPSHLTFTDREGSLALSIPLPFPLASALAHLRRKPSFSSFLSRSLCLSSIGVIFQSEIYTTLRYVLYTLLLRRCRFSPRPR